MNLERTWKKYIIVQEKFQIDPIEKEIQIIFIKDYMVVMFFETIY